MIYNGFEFKYIVARLLSHKNGDFEKSYIKGSSFTPNRNEAQKFESIEDASKSMGSMVSSGDIIEGYSIETDKGVPWSGLWDK